MMKVERASVQTMMQKVNGLKTQSKSISKRNDVISETRETDFRTWVLNQKAKEMRTFCKAYVEGLQRAM